MKFSVICASNCNETLTGNLLQSPHLYEHDLIVKVGYNCVAKAYNEAIKDATHDIMIFIHHDVFLPDKFFNHVSSTIEAFEDLGTQWGILGLAGRNFLGEYHGHILDRGNIWGSPVSLPAHVQTLDELCLIGSKTGAFSSIRFDENIPHHHLFGSDICIQAKRAGYFNFAINAFVHHNSKQGYELPDSFNDSAAYLAKKWPDELPIYSTCQDIRGP